MEFSYITTPLTSRFSIALKSHLFLPRRGNEKLCGREDGVESYLTGLEDTKAVTGSVAAKGPESCHPAI